MKTQEPFKWGFLRWQRMSQKQRTAVFFISTARSGSNDRTIQPQRPHDDPGRTEALVVLEKSPRAFKKMFRRISEKNSGFWCKRRDVFLTGVGQQGKSVEGCAWRKEGTDKKRIRWKSFDNHLIHQSGRRDSNPRPSAWKANALSTELLPQSSGQRWIRTTEGVSQQIYSLPHLATLVFALLQLRRAFQQCLSQLRCKGTIFILTCK